MTAYLILAAGVISIPAALFSFLFLVAYGITLSRDVQEFERHAKVKNTKLAFRWIGGISAVVFVTALVTAVWSYHYLLTNNREVLSFFGAWYVVGYGSRFLILIHRHQVLSPDFAIEWPPVFWALLWAILGPFITVHAIRVWLFEKAGLGF